MRDAGNDAGLSRSLALVAGFGFAGSAALATLLAAAPLHPTLGAHDATLAFTLIFLLAHCVLASVLAGLQALRVRRGYVGAHAPFEIAVVAPFWRFVTGALAVAWAAFALLPLSFARG